MLVTAKLLQRRALDQVNQELARETDYPAADKDYNHPFWSKGTEIEEGKVASPPKVEMHTTPKILPPRHDSRSLLDGAMTEEMNKDPDLNPDIKRANGNSIQLTRDQDRLWQDSYQFYLNDGRHQAKAVELADAELIEQWPELANYEQWTSAPLVSTAKRKPL